MGVKRGVIATVAAAAILTTGTAYGASKWVQAQQQSLNISVNGSSVSSSTGLTYNGHTYIDANSLKQALVRLGVNVSIGNGSVAISNKKSSASSSHKSSSGSSTRSADTPFSDQGITFAHFNISTDSVGTTHVKGVATNTTNQTHTFTFIVSFYNGNGDIVATGDGVMNDLRPGDGKPFDVMIMDDLSSAKTWRIQIDTMVQ